MHKDAPGQAGQGWRGVVDGLGRGTVIAGTILLVAILAFGWSINDSRNRALSTSRENDLVNAVQRLVGTVTNIQSSERGYVLTGVETFLAPYRSNLEVFDARVEAARKAYGAIDGDPSRIETVVEFAKAEVAFAGRVIESRRSEGFETSAALVRDGEGKRIMDALRDATKEIIDLSSNIILKNEAHALRTGWIQTATFAAAVLAAIILAILAFRRRRETRTQTLLMEGLLENAPVGIGFLDERSRILRANAPFNDILADAAGRPVWESQPALAGKVAPLFLATRRDGTVATNIDIEIAAGDDEGETRSALLSAFPVTTARRSSKTEIGIVLIETTRRKQAERRLKQTEGRFRSLIEATTSIVWSAPVPGRFATAQPTWMRFTGQSEAGHLGSGWIEAVHPDDRDMTMRLWSAALGDKKVYSIEHRVRRADGEWRIMSVRAVPILDEDGSVIEWIGTHTDVTDLRTTQERLGETGEQFETLADNIPQMAWMAEPSGEIFWYNKRWFEYTGMTLEDMRGWGWRTVHHPDHEARVVQNFQSQFASGEVWEDTFPLRGADGGYRWFLSQATPVRDGEGRILRWFGTNTDVTRQRAFEEELAAAKEASEQANKAKSQFIANMSHELRTPLSAVIGYAEMLEEEMEDLGETHLLSDLRKIESNARHLLSLINDVLDLSKIEAERMDVYAETFDVGTVIDEVSSTVGSLLSKKTNRLVIEKGEGLGDAHTDQVKLRQCLINLLSNASKFTEDGTVTIRATRESDGSQDWLSFEIVDTGIGMSQEQVERLFERFTQADPSTTRRFGGTGLGLAITRAFCRLLGGDIGVRSEEGKGSTFTIRIPAEVERPAQEDEIRHLPRSAASDKAAGLVLAIDDDPNARELLTRFLSKEGFAVRTASDGAAGLEMARAIRPDVIILDVTMPRMDGWAVLTELKADPVLAGVPVVMVTIIDEHNLGYSLGASDYLLKPVEWSKLKSVMSRYKAGNEGLVLAIDDDADTLARFSSMMARENIPVVTAPNGAAGLERVAERIPTLILLDLVMPVMDGFGFLEALRARPEWRSIPVVVLTSKDLTAEEWKRLQNDADQVLAKADVVLRDLAGEMRVIIDSGIVGEPPLNLPNSEVELRT